MTQPNYYEILGVATHVGSGQIQAAYRFARSLYSGESAATHGLLDAEERIRMLALVEEAFATLSNPNGRRDYDSRLSEHPSNSSAASESSGTRPAVADKPPKSPPPAPLQARPDASIEPLRVPDLVNGRVLQSLRESRNLSLDQIAALSKVGTRFLKALEEDRHSALPGRVFARGFLIEYARAVRAPESEIVERYLKHWTQG